MKKFILLLIIPFLNFGQNDIYDEICEPRIVIDNSRYPDYSFICASRLARSIRVLAKTRPCGLNIDYAVESFKTTIYTKGGAEIIYNSYSVDNKFRDETKEAFSKLKHRDIVTLSNIRVKAYVDGIRVKERDLTINKKTFFYVLNGKDYCDDDIQYIPNRNYNYDPQSGD